ncbi:Uncharacterized protein LW94_7892 [Fusarium fujikuroi]|nr:Uncharacterized protein LW94_7892 [Fusarium fujikuroi]
MHSMACQPGPSPSQPSHSSTTIVEHHFSNDTGYRSPIKTIMPDGKPESEEGIMGHYWPDVVKAINGGEVTLRDAKINCVICREPTMSSGPDDVIVPEPEESHRAVVVPCGHIFGSTCLRSWFDNLKSAGAPVRCPTCRTDCFHPHPTCQHPFYGVPMPTNVPDMAQIPRIIQDGGKITEGCGDCRRAKALIDIYNQVRMMADAPDELKLYFIIEVEDDGESYYSGVNGLARLRPVLFPDAIIRFIREYRDKAARLEDSDDIWVSGRVSSFTYALWARDSAESES